MSETRCASPLSLGVLSDYWLGELAGDDAARTGATPESEIEEHLFACAECSRRLQWVVDLAGATRSLAKRGLLRVVVGDEHLRRLGREGLRVREYRVENGGSVACTITPEDDLVVARLAARFRAPRQLDLVLCDAAGSEQGRLPDVAVDSTRGEVLVTEPVDGLRRLGKTTVRLRLVAVEERGESLLGEYVFNHTPHAAP